MTENFESELFELEKIRFLIKDACGLDIAYAYDDLIFAEYGLFLIRFENKTGTKLSCWFNEEINEADELKHFSSLIKTATLNSCEISYCGRFRMTQRADSDEIDIEFLTQK